MDEVFQELLGVNSETALYFFVEGLSEVAQKSPNDEIFYVASVLAHYSQTSRYDNTCEPCPANLVEVFDKFVIWGRHQTSNDPKILEIGGSQILFLAGFFRDQMRKRHRVGWYDTIGQALYERAGENSVSPRKRELFSAISSSFQFWTINCCLLSRKTRYDRFLLKPNQIGLA